MFYETEITISFFDWIFPFYYHPSPFDINELNEMGILLRSHHREDSISPVSLFNWLPFDIVWKVKEMIKSIEWNGASLLCGDDEEEKNNEEYENN